ncbi:MAG: hypothetical protein HQM03_21660 [Magnetococcales bacterium]|nr:hypothetical protein [Magnetococcales bacterium]
MFVFQQVQHAQSRGKRRTILEGINPSILIVGGAERRINHDVGAFPFAPCRQAEYRLYSARVQVIGDFFVIFMNTDMIHD